MLSAAITVTPSPLTEQPTGPTRLVFMGAVCTPNLNAKPWEIQQDCVNVYAQCNQNGCTSRDPSVDARIRQFQQQINNVAPSLRLDVNGRIDASTLQALSSMARVLLNGRTLNEYQAMLLKPFAAQALSMQEIVRHLDEYQHLLDSLPTGSAQGFGQPPISTPYEHRPEMWATHTESAPSWVKPALVVGGIATVSSILVAVFASRK